MFSLVTSYYQSGNKERQKEIDACLVQNVQNVHIKSIHLLNDQDYPLDFISDKSKIVKVVVDEGNKRRLGYDYAIQYVNESLFKEHFIIANSDIYFDDTLLHLRDYDFTSAILALSRYDDGVLNNRADSQDCWIGLSPLRVVILNSEPQDVTIELRGSSSMQGMKFLTLVEPYTPITYTLLT